MMDDARTDDQETYPSSERRPNPDPTRLTIAAMRHDVMTLRELMEAKLNGVMVYVDTRLKALDLSITKLEADRTRQFEQQAVLIQTLTEGLEGRIGDNKERVIKLESMALGRDIAIERRNLGAHNSVQDFGLIIGVIIGVAGILVALWTRSTIASAPPPVTIVSAPQPVAPVPQLGTTTTTSTTHATTP